MGHFGWNLPAMVTDRPSKVLTLVREPLQRLQSKFDYLRQHKRVPENRLFADWLEQEMDICDMAVSFFLPGILGQHAGSAGEIAAIIRPRLAEAIGNLRSCVVGVQESLEPSLNLFADAWPCLLPPMAPRVNVTIDRLQAAIKPRNITPALAEILDTETEFCQEAVALFHSQHAALKQRIEKAIGRELQSEPELREYLREKYLASVAVDGGMDFRPHPTGNSSFIWDAADRYLGSNLHDRERHGGQWLRWTGPETVTEFLLPIPPNTDYRLTFQLHMATPPAHGIGASLQIEGQPVPLVVEWSPKEFRMEAIVSASQFPDRKGKFARIAISHPVVREANAFRHVGLALISIEVATIGPEFFSDLSQLEADDVTVAR